LRQGWKWNPCPSSTCMVWKIKRIGSKSNEMRAWKIFIVNFSWHLLYFLTETHRANCQFIWQGP
jgi:hypothetical protein